MPITRDARGMAHFMPPPPEPVMPVDLEPEIPKGAQSVTTEDGTTVTTMPDGTVVIGDADVLGDAGEIDGDFSDNIADKIGGQLTAIASDLLDGIEADIRSRQAMVGAYTKGIDMLGLKIEDRSGRRQRKNVSTIRHPVLLEAVIDFQSATCAELLPASGPCKVAVAGGLTDGNEGNMARQLEADMNFYLTTTATEYYPDTDRGFFYLGYGGTLFKKIYECPLRGRPVVECVYLTDLIVSENATDLDNAIRVTHKIEMTQAQVRRMQLAKVWRDVKLISTPSPSLDVVKQKVKTVQGLSGTTTRLRDLPYTIYECYCELIPSDYGFKEKDAPDDMPLPYRVTLDKDSRVVLDVRRAWKQAEEGEPSLYEKNLPFVMYGLVPGLGFLCLGFLHILGNQAMALTAIWRILVDAGMFNCFPGGVKVKGTRQTTNEIQPGPGEWAEIDTGPMDDIRKALMPMPYKEPSQVFIQLSEIIAQNAQRLSGAIKMDVGEGKSNVPVGTIMAMIEQQTKNMAAVHKRLHAAQQREFIKLKELFAKNPEAIYRSNPKARKWKAEEFKDLNLVPASDPNVPSQLHRIMLATAKVQLAKENPEIYDQVEAHMQAWQTMGVDASEFIHQPAPQQGPDTKTAMAMAQVQGKQQDSQVKMAALQQKEKQQQREAADRMVISQTKDKQIAAEQQRDAADRETKEKIALINQQTEKMRMAREVESERLKRTHEAVTSHFDREHEHAITDKQLASQKETANVS